MQRPYAIVFAPLAEAQVDEALRWWRVNRRAAPELLAREIEESLDLLGSVPEVGRRVASRRFGNVRRLLLRGTGYHLYYQTLPDRREIHVVALRHTRRRRAT